MNIVLEPDVEQWINQEARHAGVAPEIYIAQRLRNQHTISHDDFAIDHIHPRADGGSDDLANLAWSCQGCNNRKYTATEAIDPTTGVPVPLYNPREDHWSDHFVWSDDFSQLEGISP